VLLASDQTCSTTLGGNKMWKTRYFRWRFLQRGKRTLYLC